MRFIFAAIALAASACIQANGAALPLTSTDVPALAKRVVITNEHHLNWIGRPRAVKIADRAVDPAKKAEVDAAVAVTAHLPRYFWSGSFAPGGRENSVEMYAREMATARGGTTLEGTLANVVMPTWAEDDQDSVDLWDYASAHFAEQTTGETYVVLGETMRSAADGNVWLTIELPRIRNNPAVPRVLGFRIHRDNTEMPHIYYDAGAPNPPAPQAQTTYATSTACSAFASVGEWDRQLSPTQTHNIATTTEHGMWYGGMRTPGSNTTWTYSTVPAVDRTVRSQREMVAWITSHPTFEARWNSLLDNEPAEIDAHDGRGFIPFATACAWSAESTDQMNNLKLRALPVGDGLTSGLGSRRFVGYRNNIKQIVLVPPRYRTITVQPGNGGRPRRQEELPLANNIIDLIGSQRNGDCFNDPDNEGHAGAVINDIGGFVDSQLANKPNVVFLTAGLNDIDQFRFNGAADRLMAVVDRITAALPTAVVFVATIPRTNNFLTDFIADRYNSDINRLLLRRSADGFRVMPVRMDDIAPDEYADRLHPNDAGYRKMSDNWFAALRQAVKRGWVVPAEGDLSDPNSGNPDNGACPDDSGTSSPASSSTSTSEDNSGQTSPAPSPTSTSEDNSGQSSPVPSPSPTSTDGPPPTDSTPT